MTGSLSVKVSKKEKKSHLYEPNIRRVREMAGESWVTLAIGKSLVCLMSSVSSTLESDLALQLGRL